MFLPHLNTIPNFTTQLHDHFNLNLKFNFDLLITLPQQFYQSLFYAITPSQVYSNYFPSQLNQSHFIPPTCVLFHLKLFVIFAIAFYTLYQLSIPLDHLC